MYPQNRCSGSWAVALAMAAAFWGALPACGVGFSAEQAAPGAGSSRVLTLEQRGDIFMARKNYADAVDYYYRALKESTFKNAVVWNKLGIAFQQEGKYHSARKAYTSATRADKTFAEAWNNLGTVYFMEKKYAHSVKFYQRAIEVKTDNATFHINLGISYSRMGKFAEAVQEYRTALAIDPKVLAEESSMGTVIHTTESDVKFYFYMAKAFASVGDEENAVRYLRRALEDGFNDRKRIDEDPDFKKISKSPAFIELMRNPPVGIKE